MILLPLKHRQIDTQALAPPFFRNARGTVGHVDAMTSTVSTTGSAEDSAYGEVSAAALEGHRAGHQEREVGPAPQEAESQQGSDDDDDNESSTQSESTWLFRAQYKTDELRKLFNLPESEVIEAAAAPTP